MRPLLRTTKTALAVLAVGVLLLPVGGCFFSGTLPVESEVKLPAVFVGRGTHTQRMDGELHSGGASSKLGGELTLLPDGKAEFRVFGKIDTVQPDASGGATVWSPGKPAKFDQTWIGTHEYGGPGRIITSGTGTSYYGEITFPGAKDSLNGKGTYSSLQASVSAKRITKSAVGGLATTERYDFPDLELED